MRYVVAMIFAIVCAVLATITVSSPIATWVTAHFRYDNPDSVADVHSLVFMAANITALLIGWLIGWLIAGAFERPEPEI